MALKFRDIKKNLVGIYQRIIKNIVSLGNDSTLESNLKPLKVGEKNTPIELSETEVSIKGTLNYNGSEVITEAGDVDSLNDLSDVTYSSGDLTITSLDKIVAGGDLTLDVDGDLILNPKEGKYIAQKDGTEFSAADSAYAGMILGYTHIGLDEAAASYNLTTGYVVPTSEFKVVFVAPPSGNVEIFIQIQFDCGGNGVGDLYAGLSDNATYNTIEDIHEKFIMDQSGRFGLDTVHLSWTKTGLTAGTSYTYYAGFKSSSATGTPHLQWGGNAADRSPGFIMKAVALPATIAT